MRNVFAGRANENQTILEKNNKFIPQRAEVVKTDVNGRNLTDSVRENELKLIKYCIT